MLEITVPAVELYDSRRNEFFMPFGDKDIELRLEHSLVSLSKWEMTWQKPFLKNEEKSKWESTDYVRCMTLNKNMPPVVYQYLTNDNLRMVKEYIENPMTATTFSDRDKKKTSRKIITSEVIYYWMVSYNIPFECEKWHLNRLLTLINVCSIENQPKKKMSRKDELAQRKALNESRRKQFNTRG